MATENLVDFKITTERDSRSGKSTKLTLWKREGGIVGFYDGTNPVKFAKEELGEEREAILQDALLTATVVGIGGALIVGGFKRKRSFWDGLKVVGGVVLLKHGLPWLKDLNSRYNTNYIFRQGLRAMASSTRTEWFYNRDTGGEISHAAIKPVSSKDICCQMPIDKELTNAQWISENASPDIAKAFFS